MTKIRRIAVSQVEGSDANNTDTNEIRPFGETAFYLDTQGDTSKLVLMMFDGARIHQKSKVLSPGVLFGSNADSGDGAGLDTIKLIPDATLHYDDGNYNNHQHLIIDPTAPNHIHIRPGGPIDNSNADLFLGGELTHVKVSDGYDNVVIRTSTLGEGVTPHAWIFGADSSLTFPDGTNTTGQDIWPPVDGGLGITLSRNVELSAVAAVDSGEGVLYIDTSENDDISVVNVLWQLNTGTLTAPILTPVTNSVTPEPGIHVIFVSGFTFVPGETYTFRNNSIDAASWVFLPTSELRTPGFGTISHQNNDLKVEVSGTDVIVLRTAGGDLIVNADASLTFNDGVSKISVLDPAQSGGVGGLSVNGKDRTYIGISSDAFGYNWDFRAFGLNDETTEKPTIMFPGGGWLQEDISDIANGGFNVPMQLGSQGAFTLTVKNNSNLPAAPSTYNWTFGTDGSLILPNEGIVRTGNGTSQVGSTMTIATDSNGGTGAGTPNVVDVAYDNTIIPTYYYPGGGAPNFTDSTITFANGDVRTITSIISTGGYIEITYSGITTTSNPEFPIILKTGNYVAATTAPEWTFGTDGNLTFSDNTIQTTAWAGGRVVTTPASSIGAAGNKQGDLAFDGSYMYYCTQDFASETYSTTIVATYSGLYPDIVKGSIPQPQAGWAFVHNGTTYTLASNAVENNPGEWNCELTTSISVTAGDSVTVGPVFSTNIWKRIAWGIDTW